MEKKFILEKNAVLRKEYTGNISSHISDIYDDAFLNGCQFVVNTEWVDVDGSKWAKWNYGAIGEENEVIDQDLWLGHPFSVEEMKSFCQYHHVRIPRIGELRKLDKIAYFNISAKKNYYKERVKIGEVVIPCRTSIWAYDEDSKSIKKVGFKFNTEYNEKIDLYHYRNEHVEIGVENLEPGMYACLHFILKN